MDSYTGNQWAWAPFVYSAALVGNRMIYMLVSIGMGGHSQQAERSVHTYVYVCSHASRGADTQGH